MSIDNLEEQFLLNFSIPCKLVTWDARNNGYTGDAAHVGHGDMGRTGDTGHTGDAAYTAAIGHTDQHCSRWRW